MQQIVSKSFCTGADSVQKLLHLKSANSDEMFNVSSMLPFDSDDDNSISEDFNINFSKAPSQDFGLGYWINHTTTCPQPPLPCHTTDRSVHISKSSCSNKAKDTKVKKFKKGDSISKNRHNDESSQLKSTTIKYNKNDVTRLKIPKNAIKNYFQTLSPNNSSESSSSESEFSLHSFHNEKSTNRVKLKSNRRHIDSSSSSTIKDSNCLEKSFEKSIYSESNSHLSVANHDRMSLSLTIDRNVYSNFLNSPRNNRTSTSLKSDKYLASKDKSCEPKHKENLRSNDMTGFIHKTATSTSISTMFYPDTKRDRLSSCCDIESEGKQSIVACQKDDSQASVVESKQVNKTPVNNIRKRSFDSKSEDYKNSAVTTKKKFMPACSDDEVAPIEDTDNTAAREITPIEFVKYIMLRLKTYEGVIYEKYCLSQPNAMKFLAQNHATNWESNKNEINQMHLVPYEFLNEIFHRALHCFGLEKKILKETMSGNSSPMDSYSSSHSAEYRKIRDEYSFSLKRVRYGIGVIDELFRRKVNYQNIPQNNDVPIVRKWKHIIYYLCLHAKSAFMAKEIQYHNYVHITPNSFESALDVCSDSTSSTKFSSNIALETYNKPQPTPGLTKDGKLGQKRSPDHLSQSDLEISPHSYDSGKGSSVRMSSHAPSLVSGCHTTSSLNSTPHSITDLQPNLPGYQLYRIDEYQSTASDYVRLLPEAAQLHQKILGRVGTEPNANSRDNMVKLICYMDTCQQLCDQDLMSECLQRLLTRALRL